VILKTGENEHTLEIAPKPDGFGSSANGGELLFLALATCYCNDIYREARKRGISVRSVEVDVTGEFGGEGEPGRRISYRSAVEADASRKEVLDLMHYTDSVAEIQNTLRGSNTVALTDCEVREA
jgi:organic hydroperoxide reductase OsmC/OhrA